MTINTLFTIVTVIGLNGFLILGCDDSNSDGKNPDTSGKQTQNDTSDSQNESATPPENRSDSDVGTATRQTDNDTDSQNQSATSPMDTAPDYTYRYEFESPLDILPESVSRVEIITPGPDNLMASRPDKLYMVETDAELDAFQTEFFQVEFDIPKSYFDTGVLLIHPKSTFGGPIEDLAVSVANNTVTIEYNWEDGGADCYCYQLVVVYVSTDTDS